MPRYVLIHQTGRYNSIRVFASLPYTFARQEEEEEEEEEKKTFLRRKKKPDCDVRAATQETFRGK